MLGEVIIKEVVDYIQVVIVVGGVVSGVIDDDFKFVRVLLQRQEVIEGILKMWEILREFVYYLRIWLFIFLSGDYVKVSWCFQCVLFWKFIFNSG